MSSTFVSEFKADLASAHVRQQAARFGRLAVVAFLAQLATLGTGHLTGEALAGVAVGAVEAAYRQWAPVVPWVAVARRLHLIAAPQPTPTVVGPPPTAPPATVPTPPVSGE